MPSNQQRRDAAKRKLQRQLVRRQQRAVAQRRRMMIVGVVAAVLVIAGGVWFFSSRGSNTAATDDASSTGDATPTVTSSTEPATPCSYPASGTAAKDVTAPTNLSPANTGTVDATVTLNSGALTVALDRANAPCAVESFLSLADQHYFDDTPCHRLTTAATLKVLQCGDPTGTGTGGPGYSFADELSGSEKYTAGTVAMANGGPNTNGSQFFIVYADSQLTANYTVLGKVTSGLDVVTAIADKGAVKDGTPASDGAPADPVTITSVTVPAGSADATAAATGTGTAADTGTDTAAADTAEPSGAESDATADTDTDTAASSTEAAAPSTSTG